jgi:TRAP-type C4-dicarboxylate transport system permease small subunit
MTSIRKALTWSELMLGGVCVLALAGMVALAAAAVFFRFVVNSSLAFPDEVVRYLFIWSVFLGSAIALRRNMHAAVEMAVDWLPARARRAVLIFANLLCIGFFIILTVYGIRMVITVHPQISPALEISMSYVYAAVPVGAVFMLIYALEALVLDLSSRAAPPPVAADS